MSNATTWEDAGTWPYRMPVPGGWIYAIRDDSGRGAESCVFVPAPAALIAAAPDLLAALEAMIPPGGGVVFSLECQAAARAAIAKAKGEAA